MFIEFINQYGTAIMYTVLMAVAGYFGIVAKKYFDKWFDSKEKKDVVKVAVRAVEQIYKDLHGEDKLNKALEAAEEMLASKGITITSFELKMLVEAAVGEFNKAFEKKQGKQE